jgi:hypothetical protein
MTTFRTTLLLKLHLVVLFVYIAPLLISLTLIAFIYTKVPFLFRDLVCFLSTKFRVLLLQLNSMVG